MREPKRHPVLVRLEALGFFVDRIEGNGKLPRGFVRSADVACDPASRVIYVPGALSGRRAAALALHEAAHILNAEDAHPGVSPRARGLQRRHIRKDGSDVGVCFRALMLARSLKASSALIELLERDYDIARRSEENP